MKKGTMKVRITKNAATQPEYARDAQVYALEGISTESLERDGINLLIASAEQVRSWCIPGMNWTDDIAQDILRQFDVVLAKLRGEG